jgi:hypothetical protein
MNPSVVQHFLLQVSRRQKVVSFGRQGRFVLLISLGLYSLALMVSRLSGLFSGWFTPVTLTAFLASSLIPAWIFYKRTSVTDAARLVDTQMGTHDLFLTASQIEHSLGAYQSLVLREAEQRAAQMFPQKIVPYYWQRDTLRLCAALTLLLLGVYLLPQFDPFGLHERQRQMAEQREQLRKIGKATELRATLLEARRGGDQTEAVKQALVNLEKAFQNASPTDKAGTLARLNEQQRILGQLWKQVSEDKLKNTLNLPPPTQSFGLADPSKAEQLRNDLQKGDVSSASKELEALKRMTQELAKTQDPIAREKLRQELMDRLQNLKDTLDQQLNSQALDSDMQRALEQLALANVPGLSSQALKDMSDSLSLSQEELQQLAKAMADMQDIEKALQALQLAKMLNNLQPLDGQDFVKLGDLAAYAAFCEGKCRSLLAGMGLGAGYGIGRRPYGDENSTNRFQPEKSPSLLQPGRMLMEWKTRKVSEAGPAREEYLRAVQDVRQKASEAVVEEQIPPGYQAAIKKYFDTLPNDTGAHAQP